MTTDQPAARLWTIQEVADYLGIPLRTIYQWRTKGAGPRGIRVGRHLRFREADVETWLQSQSDAP